MARNVLIITRHSYTVYSAVFLHKALVFGAFSTKTERDEIWNLVCTYILVLEDAATNTSHLGYRYSKMLKALWFSNNEQGRGAASPVLQTRGGHDGRSAAREGSAVSYNHDHQQINHPYNAVEDQGPVPTNTNDNSNFASTAGNTTNNDMNSGRTPFFPNEMNYSELPNFFDNSPEAILGNLDPFCPDLTEVATAALGNGNGGGGMMNANNTDVNTWINDLFNGLAYPQS